jgi:hypothetical protein
MSAMAALIVSTCMNSTDIDKSNCIRGLEQSIKEIGLYDDVDNFESYLQKRSLKEIVDVLGLDRVRTMGAAAYLTKTAIDKSVSIKLPTFGLCDSISTQAGVDRYGLRIEWKF